MTFSDIEWLSQIFNDMKHCAVSLRQLSCLFIISSQWLTRVMIPAVISNVNIAFLAFCICVSVCLCLQCFGMCMFLSDTCVYVCVWFTRWSSSEVFTWCWWPACSTASVVLDTTCHSVLSCPALSAARYGCWLTRFNSFLRARCRNARLTAQECSVNRAVS